MWNIKPGVSVGPLRLGMREDEYVKILGPISDVFRRTPESTEEIVAYDNAGVHLTVDEEQRVCQISVFPPNNVVLADINLLGRKTVVVVDDLSRTEFRFRAIDSGYWCESANILLVDVDGLVDGIEVGIVAEGQHTTG